MRLCAMCKKQLDPEDGIVIDEKVFCNLSHADEFKYPIQSKESFNSNGKGPLFGVLFASIVVGYIFYQTVGGSGQDKSVGTTVTQATATPTSQSTPVPKPVNIPQYKILNQKPEGEKITITVSLPSGYGYEQLNSIAYNVKANLNNSQFKNIFIFHLTPDMNKESEPYATTHFDRNLRVKVYGTTDEEKVKKAEVARTGILGKWRQTSVKADITIKKSGSGYVMNWAFSDGSYNDKLLTRSVGDELQFSKSFKPGDGYFVIKDDWLYLYSSEGREIESYFPAD